MLKMRDDLLTAVQQQQSSSNKLNGSATSSSSSLGNEVRIKLNIHTKYRYQPQQSAGILANAGKIDYLDSLNKNLADAVSLHEVKNIWMCLNYEKRPTVSHVIDYIRKYYNCLSQKFNENNISSINDTTINNNNNNIINNELLSELNLKSKSSASRILDASCNNNISSSLSPVNDHVKLFLDDYFLPPYENSRLIRENDCVR